MKIVFFGTPDYVLPVLKALYKTCEVVSVVTQNPKEVGRKKFITRSPVDNWAYKHKIPVTYDFAEIPSADLGVVAAYGRIIPKSVIANFKFGILNIHPSLLPKWRGASPVQAAILSGETETGVSIIKMDEEVDHGPIVAQFKEDVLPDDTAGSLRARLFERSADVLTALIKPFVEGKITPRLQNHKEATSTHLIKKQNGFIDLKKTPPEEAERFIRAMQPWPVSWTYVHLAKSDNEVGYSKLKAKRRLKILDAHTETLSFKHSVLRLDEVQLEGKNPVSWKEFELGYPNAEFA